MKALRRVLAMAMAALLAASPASACDAFCPEHSGNHRAEAEIAAADGHSGMTMSSHEGCAEDQGSPQIPSEAQQSDCAGSPDCAVAKSIKKQALATTAAIPVVAPVLAILSGPLAEVRDDQILTRRHVTPPAEGPPLASTPVSLKNILRI